MYIEYASIRINCFKYFHKGMDFIAHIYYARKKSLYIKFNKLKVTYNSIAQYVYGRTRYSRISEFSYKIYDISFENLLKCRTLLHLQKIIYTMKRLYLFDRLVFSRSNRDLKINSVRYRKQISKRRFYTNAISLWNKLSNNVQLLSNAKHVKNNN